MIVIAYMVKKVNFHVFTKVGTIKFSCICSPCGLTFRWWGCYCLCQRHKPTNLAHSFSYAVLVSISVFLALSTVFHFMNSPDNFPFSHSIFLVYISFHKFSRQLSILSLYFSGLSLPYWSFQQYVSL